MIEMVIIIGLAGYRLASFFVIEKGPFDLFEKLRDKVIPTGEVKGFLPSILTCLWCASAWTTLASYILWLIEPTAVMIIAGMAIAMLMGRVVNR